MYRVFGDSISGNCYKIKLVMSELALPFVWVEVDILGGDTRRPDFLDRNPNGRVPVLEIEGSGYLAESNAILLYLAEGTPLLPEDAFKRALVYQWLFFEQYSHEPYIATSRFIIRYLGSPPERADELEAKRTPGYRALDVMERQLARTEFMVGDHFSVADIALFAYTHVAGEAGFHLERYPAIRAWLDRVTERPGFRPMYAARP